MAPEVIKNEGFPTTKSDIWSIGCTVIELLTGSPPFGEESSVSVVWKIVEGEIESQFPIICSKVITQGVTDITHNLLRNFMISLRNAFRET